MSKNCEIQVNQNVAIFTIDRPPMNTLSRETLLEMETHLNNLEQDDKVRAIIITGSGDQFFSAGADITEFSDFVDMEKARQNLQVMHGVFRKMETYPKPIIACINGKAFGGGNELQMACHLAIASETAEFALPEIRLGIMPGYGGTQRLPRLIGSRAALELILTGKRITAQKALQYGLINRIATSSNLLVEAIHWAQEMASGPPIAMKAILDSVIRGLDRSLEEGIAIETENMLPLAKTEDAIEGVSAFFMKRKADFKGK
ncbi:enoyl-CoA hydratase-related protein [Bacillus sp. FJAT-49736]|uniref:enoyl-CoA hydratase/isomerase family protein n=1 Tax=Bacillus sp. FJAT-49736 TaxID=2833582 RepID=UPI001BC9A668|nr:enoyl-CoA hydratase-related protein [Bacillus sp. FJAT-49736]MBS4172907.1 enoyl-CoA hydratase/isomerase family protein [Bacillus sp. FJAT-49736]